MTIYQLCPNCGQSTILLLGIMTSSPVFVDPLPNKEGWVIPDFERGSCKVLPLKQAKKHEGPLWIPHIATCKEGRK